MHKADEILKILKELYDKHEEIHACMVAKSGLEGVIMFPESFKTQVSTLWEPLSKTMDKFLTIVAEMSRYKLDKLLFEMLGYTVCFLVLDSSDTALIVFVKPGEKKVFDLLSKQCGDMVSAREKILKLE